MIRLNIHEAKTHLSKHLRRVKKGETIILCERNVPIAEIRPIKRRIVGQASDRTDKGRFVVPPNFNDPLPDWLLDAFEGKESK